jgi:protein-S-isoprenylcysteine O-methyltransferase Ste14
VRVQEHGKLMATPLLSRQSLGAVWRVLSTVTLVSLLLVFAAAHLARWRTSGEPAGLGLVVEELLVAALFLLRRQPKRASSSLGDWLLAAGGSWLILAVRPAGHPVLGLEGLYLATQFAGLLGVIVSLTTLGRSFGIVAADRGLKTGGPYSVVRHPVYLSYLVTQVAYLLQNPSLWNAAIVLTVTACQLGRIRAEERILSCDAGYRAYCARVAHRLIPAIY